ncbi:MAG TPA: glucose 1-dehydrogenase [Xanthobacteraceae bacterium]|nr:glucose 1-dehydrogenase [Xanthobacteraceae bacterium]
MGRVEGKVAIVTGAGSGIGRAGAAALAREGARVVATDLAPASAEETAAAIRRAGGEAIAIAHDVGEESQWAAVIAATYKAFGKLDVLVNNAGVSGKGSLADTAPEDWRALMRVNLDGVYLGTRAAIAAMTPEGKERDQFGSIIMISSILGLVGGARSAPYSASKGAVRFFAKSVALECATRGQRIRVNSIHPGYIDTPLLAAVMQRRAEQDGTDVASQQSDLVKLHPLGRLGTPEDIAAGIVFLASEESSFMTGSELVIDGGYTAR